MIPRLAIVARVRLPYPTFHFLSPFFSLIFDLPFFHFLGKPKTDAIADSRFATKTSWSKKGREADPTPSFARKSLHNPYVFTFSGYFENTGKPCILGITRNPEKFRGPNFFSLCEMRLETYGMFLTGVGSNTNELFHPCGF